MDQNKAIKHRATGINYKIDGLENLSRIRGTEFSYRLEIALVVLVLGSNQLSKEKERGTRKKLIVQGFYLARPPNSQVKFKVNNIEQQSERRIKLPEPILVGALVMWKQAPSIKYAFEAISVANQFLLKS